MPAAAGSDVVLIGFQDQGNLGMGYLASSLQAHGYSVVLLDYRDGVDRLVAQVVAESPAVVGLSLIFQYYLPGFRALAQRLRQAGVRAHLTIGGHYPSLCHDEVLAAMPELDSVVRFEGELTLVDLVTELTNGRDWRVVPGLAYLADGHVVVTPERALAADLDTLPFPVRVGEPERVLGLAALPVLASRGCARRCSFCSIHTFYRTAPGKVVRVRQAVRVVDELAELYEQRGVRVVLFQDDDFPLWGRAGRKWVDELAGRLRERGLADRILWKISCRAEYVEPELFGALRDVGLYLVYMGLESGVEAGLVTLHKQVSVEQNRTAVAELKALGLMFEYGFMLFDPSSTFDSVRANVEFLRSIVGDGSAAATFCRMLPYGGTPIRDQLAAEGRLRGDVTRPDYDFLDLRLNGYHRLLDRAAGAWVHGNGVSHQLNWAWNELEIADRLVPDLAGVAGYRTALRALTARSNGALFDYVTATADAYEAGDDSPLRGSYAQSVCGAVEADLLELRNDFVAGNAAALLDAAAATAVRGPILAPQVF